MFSSIIRGAGSVNGTPSSTSRAACAMHATISDASASDSGAVACTSQIRTSTVPKLKCGRTDHHTWVNSTIELRAQQELDVVAIAPQPPNASGTPQRGKLLVKLCVRAECRPAVAAVEVRRVRRDREQQRQHRAQPVADAHGAVEVTDAEMDVQAERVVAPRDVLQPLLDAAVVLGVDDRLLAVVRPGMRAGGAERDALRSGEREQPPAVLALARERVARSPPTPEMISISEEISSPVMLLVQQRIARRGGVAQLLEARHQCRASAGRGSRTPPRCRR